MQYKITLWHPKELTKVVNKEGGFEGMMACPSTTKHVMGTPHKCGGGGGLWFVVGPFITILTLQCHDN